MKQDWPRVGLAKSWSRLKVGDGDTGAWDKFLYFGMSETFHAGLKHEK